jgi:hypothetical protein
MDQEPQNLIITNEQKDLENQVQDNLIQVQSELPENVNMKLEIIHQEKYSRLQAVVRALFGYYYIMVPHYFIIFFLAIWSFILNFVGFCYIMFTGKYPKEFFNYQVNLYRWLLRVDTSYLGLYDSYPAFGLDTKTPEVTFEVKYPETWKKDQVALIFFLGIFMAIPHLILVMLFGVAAYFLSFFAWFAVIFTGKFPKEFHDFIVKYYRWYYRVGLWLGYMYPTYPRFNGLRDEEQTETY